MKDILKGKKLFIILFAVTFIALAVLGALFDMQISETVVDINAGSYYSENVAGRLVEIFSLAIPYFLGGFCGIVIGYKIQTGDKLWALCFVFYILSLVPFILGVRHMAKYTAKYYFSLNIYYILAISLVLYLIPFCIVQRLKNRDITQLVKFCIFVLGAIGLSQAAAEILKPIFGRARYAYLNYLGDFSGFSPWYLPNGKRTATEIGIVILDEASDVYKSFPSGHVTSAAIVYSFILLPCFYENLDKKSFKIPLIILTVLLTGFVAFYRIRVGAHYFSDTLFGGTITFVSVFVSYYVLRFVLKKFSKNE